MDGLPQGVGRTALATAWMRAQESRRPDRLFDDWLAQAFADAGADATPVMTPKLRERLGARTDALFTYMAARTRFFDDQLIGAAVAGCRQVVLLAAGLDSRAYRLPWPDGTRLFELDRPDLVSFKERVLAGIGLHPRCRRDPIIADLTAADWPERLTRAGFRPDEPTAWLAEGILVYLDQADAERVLTIVTELSAPSSALALEDAKDLPKDLFDQAADLSPMDGFAGLWKGGLAGETAVWLGEHHWRGREITIPPVADALGRPLAAPLPLEGTFVTASRVGVWETAGVVQVDEPSTEPSGKPPTAGQMAGYAAAGRR